MEHKELNQEEIIAIFGGSELTEGLLTDLGIICKGFYYYFKSPYEGGYSYGKCGY